MEHKKKLVPGRMETEGLDNELNETDEKATMQITLVSNEKHRFKLPIKHATISNVIKVAFEEDDTSHREITFDCPSKTLERIVAYMKKCEGEETIKIDSPLKIHENSGKELKEIWVKICGPGHGWHADFMWNIAKNRIELAKLTKAADQYEIKGLLLLCVSIYATFLKFCPLDDIDRILDPKITDGNLLPHREDLKDTDLREEEYDQPKKSNDDEKRKV
mmetsp:Transcript_26705/g.42938  ORF Transcript_26705/g.42938 Transcript_26705/m.42938 type:complete len:219 (+) Transcript_26705:145-801(+)